MTLSRGLSSSLTERQCTDQVLALLCHNNLTSRPATLATPRPIRVTALPEALHSSKHTMFYLIRQHALDCATPHTTLTTEPAHS
jgi:hypothetical protein